MSSLPTHYAFVVIDPKEGSDRKATWLRVEHRSIKPPVIRPVCHTTWASVAGPGFDQLCQALAPE